MLNKIFKYLILIIVYCQVNLKKLKIRGNDLTNKIITKYIEIVYKLMFVF